MYLQDESRFDIFWTLKDKIKPFLWKPRSAISLVYNIHDAEISVIKLVEWGAIKLLILIGY